MNCKICNKEFETQKKLTKHLIEEHKYDAEQIYKYYGYNFETKDATCPICGKKFKLSTKQVRNHRKGTSKGACCTLSCTRTLISILYGSPFSDENVRKKAKQTIIERYGVECALSSQELREKGKKTMFEKYGVFNPANSLEIREKAKKTNLERYGVEYPAQSKECQEKMAQTMMKKFGVEHGAQSSEIRKKMEQTNLKRYGVKNASQSKKIKEKREQTMIERYGVKYPAQIPEVKEKMQESMKKTNLEKYGVEYPAQSKEFQEKTKQTNLEKYGVEYSIRAEQTQKNIEKTNIERYGFKNPFSNPEIREKAEQTNLKKYGVRHASQSSEILEKTKKTNLEKYGVESFFQHEKCIEQNGFRISKVNKRFHELLLEKGIDNDLEYIIESYGYDLRAGNVLIEINPCFTHNVTKGPCFGKVRRNPISEQYHLQKTLFASSHDFYCINIFDWDDKNKIANYLKDRVMVDLNICEAKKLSPDVASEFLDIYSICRSTEKVDYACGLYNNNELIQVVTFKEIGDTRKFELLELVTKDGVEVPNGLNKLLNFFENECSPKEFICYCDLSKFNGKQYEEAGLVLVGQTKPRKHWYNEKTKDHLLDSDHDRALMIERGYVEIYDCGQLVFGKQYS